MKAPRDFVQALKNFDSKLDVAWHPHRQEWAVERKVEYETLAHCDALKKVHWEQANRPILSHLPDEVKARALARRWRSQSYLDALNRGYCPLLYFKRPDTETLREILDELWEHDLFRMAERYSADPQSNPQQAMRRLGVRGEYEEAVHRDNLWSKFRQSVRYAVKDAVPVWQAMKGSRVSVPG